MHRCSCSWLRRFSIIFILLLGWAFALFQLDTVPPGFQHDETFNVLDAIEVVYNNFRPQLYFPKNFGREPIFFYSAAAIYRYLIGVNWVWGLRFNGVLWAMPGLAFSLMLAKRYLSSIYAALAGLLLVTSFWFIFVARVGLRAITLFTVATAAFYFLLLGFEKRAWRYFILMGFMSGLAVYTYVPGRFLPPIMIAIILLESTITHFLEPKKRPSLKQTGLAILIMLITAVPMYWYVWQHPDLANQRINELNAPLQSARQGNLQPLFTSAISTIQTLLQHNRDAIPYHYSLPDRAVLSPILALLFIIGVGNGVRHWRQRKTRLLLMWLVVGLLPNMVTPGGPFFLRAIMALPAIFIFIAMGAAAVVQGSAKLLPSDKKQWGRIAAILFIIVGITWHIIRDTSGYFVTWARADDTQVIYRADLRHIASYLDSIPADTPAFISSSFWLDLDQQTYLLYNPNRRDPGWFNAKLGMPWPANQEIITIFSASSPPAPELACALAQMEPAAKIMTASGQMPLFVSYRGIPGPNNLPCDLQPLASSIKFGNSLQVDAAVVKTNEDNAIILTRWTVLGPWPHSMPPKISVRIKDSSGAVIAQKDELLAVAYQNWHNQDQFLQLTQLPVSQNDAQKPELFLVIYDAQGAMKATVEGNEIGEEAPIILPE